MVFGSVGPGVSISYFGISFILFLCFFFFFFFSSRRRHTRLVSDWSSDVCSSDLFRSHQGVEILRVPLRGAKIGEEPEAVSDLRQLARGIALCQLLRDVRRSEERRVGKECRSRWSP